MTEREVSCPTCGGTDIIDGDLSNAGGFVFTPNSERGRFLMKSSFMTARACRDCGTVFDLRLTDSPAKLTK